MIFIRMDYSLSMARLDRSKAEQFMLSWDDYDQFDRSKHSRKTSKPISLHYRGVPVLKATDANARSALHVRGTKQVYENPVMV